MIKDIRNFEVVFCVCVLPKEIVFEEGSFCGKENIRFEYYTNPATQNVGHRFMKQQRKYQFCKGICYPIVWDSQAVLHLIFSKVTQGEGCGEVAKSPP